MSSIVIGQKVPGLKLGEKHSLGVELLPQPYIWLGDKGERVKKLQQALEKLHYLPAGQDDGDFGRLSERALQAFQRAYSLKADGQYGPQTRATLQKALGGAKPHGNHTPVPNKPPPARPPPPQPASGVRERIVQVARWGIAHEPSIHYAEIRPIQGLHTPWHTPLTIDCSGFVTLCYKWAGAPDPNGNGWNGDGFTGTLLQHMRHIPESQAKPGDAVVFGPGSGNHVCLVLEPGANALLASHGSERGPDLIRYSDERAWQANNNRDGGLTTWLTLLD
jgi:cell wall-associated NlpC family hydrolase